MPAYASFQPINCFLKDVIMSGFAAFLLICLVIYWLFSPSSDSKKSRNQKDYGFSGDDPDVEESGYSRAFQPARSGSRDGDQFWLSKDKTVTIANYEIAGGWLYVGKDLLPAGGWKAVEPALINPSLKVSKSTVDRAGETMTYWPSYSEIKPEARAAYLEWLAHGRSDPSVYIGYVFLYFYSLERRLLTDQTTASERETLELIGEVERLLGIYGSNRSFASYATGLLDIAKLIHAGYAGRLDSNFNSSIPSELMTRLALAKIVADGKPIPADWALAWLMHSPESRLRTPAKRCPDEFARLFMTRYQQKYGDGLKVKPNKTRLRLAYRPASASFGGEITASAGDLPDVMAQKAPVNRLMELAEICTADLEPFSRWRGRNPDAKPDLNAIALLPNDLVAGHENEKLQELSKWLKDITSGKEFMIVKTDDLISHWPEHIEEKISKSEAVQIIHLLEKRGFGMEPDVRFGGVTPSATEKLVIFRLTAGSPAAPSQHYTAGSVLLHLASAVAVADGVVSEHEIHHLEEHLVRSLRLSAEETARMNAHLRWLLEEQPGLGGLKKRMESLSDPQRSEIGRYLVTVAGADGHIGPDEVKTLTKLYTLLGLDPAKVYSHAHELATTAPGNVDEPITVVPAVTGSTGKAIPRMPDVSGTSFELDHKAVERKLAETAAVTSLLGSIFSEDESAPLPQPPSAQSNIRNLDTAHSALFAAFQNKEFVPRAEIERVTSELGLMTDGAIEMLNEVAFDVCGEPLLDGDDPVIVNQAVWKEIRA